MKVQVQGLAGDSGRKVDDRRHPGECRRAVLTQGAAALLLVGIGAYARSGFELAVEYTAPVFWFFFLLVGVALVVLRRREPDVPRPFRVPLYPLLPAVFCATNAYLLYASLAHTGVGALVGDVVYDLGSGDGRIPITAARQYGVRAVGVEIDSRLVKEAKANATKAGVSHLVTIREEDLFQTDFREASVVTLYLLSTLNEKLRPKLPAELKPGSRIVSHSFRMGDWEPEKTEMVGGSVIYLWRVLARKAAAQ